jgi:tetratricopeptide (TPR) repeat protein
LKIASPKLHTSHLTPNAEALERCEAALRLRDQGDYEGAQDVIKPLWQGIGTRPETAGLHPSVAAEVLYCVGVLNGWIGSKNQVDNAQETAKDLITESITYFESAGDLKKVAEARAEIAYCYWRSGELNEARTTLLEALKKLTAEGITRARSLLKLSSVEFSLSRYHEALRILTDNAPLFQRIDSQTFKGIYHGQVAIALRNIAKSEKRTEYTEQAIVEFQKADKHYKAARNPVFRADVKNNAALLLSNLSRFGEAHRYLDEARRLSVSFKDKARTAQFDESRAQVFLAQDKPDQAEAAARRAVLALQKSGHQCLLVDALITQGLALARMGKQERAQFILQKAYENAIQVDALSKAGLAALTLIEEIHELSPAILQAAYDRAREWLSKSEEKEILRRLNEAAGKFASSMRGELSGELSAEQATEALLNKPQALQQKMMETEREMIRQALAQANGSITHAARLLGTTYQALTYTIESRHQELLKERSPIHRRTKRNQ